MRVSVIALHFGVFFAVGNVGGTGWFVVASFPAPAPNARGIAPDAPYGISVLCDGTPPRVYNLAKPSEYISLAVPKGAWGLSKWYHLGDIVVSNYNNSYIYGLNTNGSVISSFRCPKNHPADLSGLWGKFFVAIPDDNLALELTTAGSIISSFRGPGTLLTAIDANDERRAVLGDPATHKVYFLGHGSITIAAPVGLWSDRRTSPPPYTFVWVVDAATNWVYYIDSTSEEGIVAGSFGRVKGLFK
jgi:hypothetical protein